MEKLPASMNEASMREAHTDEMFVYLRFIHHKLLHFLEICFLEIFERVHAVKPSQQTAVIVRLFLCTACAVAGFSRAASHINTIP